ncbi:MAG: antibiotic biosynthesis monooxygenase [Ignavibacteriae bacterium]|nr:antibiotic biosynthesis monooxygenase [Ignavibacteriota bacterium]MCB9205809.1 antibiotic biosynthesis monooxygenase [Ignavibacteriales bacterium]MCB9219315.1 antibiotic biosynthesis monooxygenase [Ignavibacteriales bacterium]MCB9260202.1 antibiotic biosynthesis monooxygenase [Ignavibacteriales bacterium]
MVEVAFTYDINQGIDEEAYKKLAKKATAMMLNADGFIELRANRNLLGSPHVRRTSVWESMEDWARFAETNEFQKVTHEFRKYVTHMEVNLWGPSPYVPEPIKPM